MFCKNNQIKAKAFNSKYKKYKEIFSAEESPGHLVKQENKIEDIYEDEEENEEGERDEESKDLNIPGSMITFAQSPKKSIDLVFTDFFNKYYFELNHELMVEQLADKMEEANNKIRKTHLTNGPNRIFYLLYAVLKDIGHRVTLKKYCQTISDRTGYHLTKRICSNLQK